MHNYAKKITIIVVERCRTVPGIPLQNTTLYNCNNLLYYSDCLCKAAMEEAVQVNDSFSSVCTSEINK